jgi:hypothetical protein
MSLIKLIIYLIFIGKTPEKSSSADGLKDKQVQNVWRGWLSMFFGREAASTVG